MKKINVILTRNTLVSVVKLFNSNPITVRIEQNFAKFCFENSTIKKKKAKEEKQSPTYFRMHTSEAQRVMLICPLKPTQPVWYGVV